MKYFVALSAWLFDTVLFFLFCILKCFFPNISSRICYEWGRAAACETSPWQSYDCLASYRSCLSPFEKFSARTWEINKLSETLPQQKCVCAHEGMWTRKSPKGTHAQIGQDISAQRDVQKNAHRSVEGFKYGMSRCSPGPKWKAAYLWNWGELLLLF